MCTVMSSFLPGEDTRIERNSTPDQTLSPLDYYSGRDGRDGRDGVAGATGTPGRDGERGDPGPQGPPGPPIGGLVYTRWGRTTCPPTSGTQLVYDGIAAGSLTAHKSGGTEILCMPHIPEYESYAPGVQRKSYIYGVELHPHGGPFASVRQQNMPCAVCSGTKTRVLMIPARVSCPPQWQREYSGYLMAPHSTSNYRNSFMCVDKHPDVIPWQEGDTNGSNDPHHVEATCEGLPCPPYNPEKELTSVICTM